MMHYAILSLIALLGVALVIGCERQGPEALYWDFPRIEPPETSPITRGCS